MKRRTAISTAVLAAGLVTSGASMGADWLSAGQNLNNSRFQSDETKISKTTVGALQLKWVVNTDGDVTANPAVDGDFIYFPDSAGFLYKVNRNTGLILWKRPVSDYTGIAGDNARGTPAVAGNALILGNQSGKFVQAFGQPAPQAARAFAVDKNTGDKLWATQIDATPMSIATASPVVYKGVAYVGVASNEELIAGFVPKVYGWQFQFRGSVVALDVATGAIKWTTNTVPAGYFGGSVWGGIGSIDAERNTLYVASGNNFAVPDSAQACLNGGGSPASCLAADDYFDSIIAMDLKTGKIKWGQRGLPYDAWNVGCGLVVPGFVIPPNDNCPNPHGPDYDFAQGPMLFGGDDDDGGSRVGAGQKSGVFWAFKAENGKLDWSKQVSPGGVTGGMQWGSASDGEHIYVSASNAGQSDGTPPSPWTLKNGSVVSSGGWASLDKKGNVLWTTADPVGSRAEAAVSVANGVVFGCNLAGWMYAFDAANGAVLWSNSSGAPCNAGPSIADGMVYWGSGTFRGTGAKKVFAFGL